ncbi:MAG: asparagine synthase (glutamine-hydrolyzing) [Verrucomicrobiota bacterium]
MCGICGIINHEGFPDPESTRQTVEGMLQSLGHRGPDATGFSASRDAVLGATRLAIRGISDGTQPIVDEATGVLAVCNGEIDNHRQLREWLAARGRPVRRATDVAVIPGLYLELGENFVERLAGAFAIAVWDPRHRRLLLARDRAGERPLFYAERGPSVRFATELAALTAGHRLPAGLDLNGLAQYLQFGIFPSPQTPFTEIRKVPPGGLLQFGPDGVRKRAFWRWPVCEAPKSEPSLDVFDEIFRGAVARQSDVEVNFGVFLSGGIDSSLVSAVTRSLHPDRPLKAYTLRFEEESFDEGDFAGAVAERFGMERIAVWVKPGEIPGALRDLVRLVGEPLADPAWLPAALLARRATQDVRLALVGEGADELFGGYPTYIGAAVAERYARLPRWMRSIARGALNRVPPSDKKMTVSFLLKKFVDGADLDGLVRHRFWVSNIAPPLLERLGVTAPGLPGESGPDGVLLDRLQLWDLETSLAEGLLTKADRASMSCALELRAPFLDEAVMAYAATLPPRDRVRGFNTKVFLKKYALRYLPESIVHRRKRGLSVPMGRWLRGPLRSWAESKLAGGRLETAGIRPDAVRELFREHLDRKADHARALWTLLVLAEWLDWAAEETQAGR